MAIMDISYKVVQQDQQLMRMADVSTQLPKQLKAGEDDLNQTHIQITGYAGPQAGNFVNKIV